jgi:hypothetical protein
MIFLHLVTPDGYGMEHLGLGREHLELKVLKDLQVLKVLKDLQVLKVLKVL